MRASSSSLSFTLSEIDGTPIHSDSSGRLEVWGQTRYWLKLKEPFDERSLKALAALPSSVFEHIEPDRGLLNFRNQVGLVRILGAVLNVRSHKLEGEPFAEMLREISRSLAALPFDFNAPTFLPYEADDAGEPSVLYHRWLLLNAWVEGSDGDDSLEGALGRILYDPHRRMGQETLEIPITDVSSLTSESLLSILSNPQGWSPLPPGSRLAETALGRRLRTEPGPSHFPEKLSSRRMRLDLDNPENRFIKHVLRVAQDLNRRFRDGVAALPACLNPELEARTEAIAAMLDEALSQPFFEEVGEMSHLPTQSMVLQRRVGYRDFLLGYARLEAGLRFPLASSDLSMILEAKDIAKLYEYWCYFRVAEGLTSLLGSPDSALVLEPDLLRTVMARETRLTWSVGGEPLTLSYDRTFKGGKAGESYSVTLRPDITLEWKGRRLLFDAKFKLDGVRWEDDQPDVSGAGSMREDLYKMHAYREAIAQVTSAIVLYPGPRGADSFYPRWTGEGLPRIGAIALRPREEAGSSTLHLLMERMLAWLADATPA